MFFYYTSFECAFLTLSFSANDILLAVYFIFILDYGNDVRQKANLSFFSFFFSFFFFFKFRKDHKAAETTLSINNAFAPGTANEDTVQ